MINSTLEMFGFAEYFREWIAILLKDFEACVNNSGKISTIFPVKNVGFNRVTQFLDIFPSFALM